jgi:hypothetical protein
VVINNSADLVLQPGSRLDDQASEDAVGTATITPNATVLEQVRQAIEAAHRIGQPSPGRPTLVRLTGATDHAVRKALAELANQDASAGEFDTQPNTDTTPNPGIGSASLASCDSLVSGVVASSDEPGGGLSPANDTPVIASDRTPAGAPPGGRLVALTGFVFGSVMSIAANVLHAWLPAVHEPIGWSPGIPPQVGATVWPLGLMLAVEVLSRIRWPKGLSWALARFGGAGAVAAGSAIISYGHLRDVLLAWQYTSVAAAVGPLVIDGLMVVCGFALLANSRIGVGEAGDRR